jgi:O-acetyl-ADP-ribose deacetylase
MVPDSFQGGGGIDEAIHKAAGPLLQRECAPLPLCMPGNAVITKGYRLPATYVIHAVGPYLDEQQNPQPDILRKTYEQILHLCSEYELRSIALCPISTGFYGHPKELSAKIAMKAAIDWFNTPQSSHMQRVIFVAFDDPNLSAYQTALKEYSAK